MPKKTWIWKSKSQETIWAERVEGRKTCFFVFFKQIEKLDGSVQSSHQTVSTLIKVLKLKNNKIDGLEKKEGSINKEVHQEVPVFLSQADDLDKLSVILDDLNKLIVTLNNESQKFEHEMSK